MLLPRHQKQQGAVKEDRQEEVRQAALEEENRRQQLAVVFVRYFTTNFKLSAR